MCTVELLPGSHLRTKFPKPGGDNVIILSLQTAYSATAAPSVGTCILKSIEMEIQFCAVSMSTKASRSKSASISAVTLKIAHQLQSET